MTRDFTVYVPTFSLCVNHFYYEMPGKCTTFNIPSFANDPVHNCFYDRVHCETEPHTHTHHIGKKIEYSFQGGTTKKI